jgi:hypothetical protein
VHERVTQPPPGERAACPGCGQESTGVRCSWCGAAREAGGFIVERVIAQGPHGRVYRARAREGRPVALKELSFAAVPSAQELDAFEREAETLRAIHHGAVPRCLASFREGEGVGLRLYLAAELIEGETLAERIARAPLSAEEAERIAREVLAVLGHLHRQTPALIHRDVKPQNLIVRHDGAIALVDFGSVRRLESARTHGSTLVGTFGYMPAEQLGGTVDRTSDLYALGATLLHGLTGEPPSDLRPRVPRGVSPRLGRWLERLLATNPRARPQSAEEALALLDARPGVVSRWITLGVAGLLIAGGSVALMRTHVKPIAVKPRPAVEPDGFLPDAVWFLRAKPSCNALEAKGYLRAHPPSNTWEGAGYRAGCLMLANQLDDARAVLDTLSSKEQHVAVDLVFQIANEVADKGDEGAAGPMMELVLRYNPEHPYALFHAGMAAASSGRSDQAREWLTRFLRVTRDENGDTRAAREALEKLAPRSP